MHDRDRLRTIAKLQADELSSRSEVTAMPFAFADINANVERILRLLEEEQNGGQEELEEDS